MTRLTFKLSKRINILLHIVNVLIAAICISLILFKGNFSENFFTALKYVPISYGAFCISNLWITPKFYCTKKYASFFGFFFLLALTAGVMVGLLYYKLDFNEISNSYSAAIIPIFLRSVFLHLLFVSKGFMVYMIVINYENSLKQTLIQKERVKDELQFLLFQIQPHFFLNTINNLYALALENSKKMPQALTHLADMLRHIVYNAKDNKTFLYKEIEALNCYVKILQLGYEKSLKIKVNTPSNKTVLIPSFALLTLFEGAVKHSKIGKVANSFINVDAEIIESKLNISVSNNIATSKDDEFGGCGLDNLTKQLEILYPNENILTTQIQNTTFVAKLNIPL